MRLNHPAGTGKHSKTACVPAGAGGASSYSDRITEAEWIVSREERAASATTECADEMPDGMGRLIHETSI
jgi:hypothetical protein